LTLYSKKVYHIPRELQNSLPIGDIMVHDRGRDAKSIKSKNPDRGPPMLEGAHHFDKGYESDEETFSPTRHEFPDNNMRGNSYMALNNEWQKKDAAKLSRQKFSKTA
jgi:hypothetical protein